MAATSKLDTIRLLGPIAVPGGCGGLSMAYADAVNEDECRRLADLAECDIYATDPEIASEALGYDVALGQYDVNEVAAELMRMCSDWR